VQFFFLLGFFLQLLKALLAASSSQVLCEQVNGGFGFCSSWLSFSLLHLSVPRC
jgi:hypothetical protein